ncbi:alpha/beta fold hydrolase [Tenacibaculum aiptasiae]|uniref:Alpha/beta fold hydrolase n=1 Tax=Tenacibaculum aiptasiae TaxID=426481 RepID=A0A7J5AI42_9FLAO|nr:alpha/beta fold hydrolase [Tenacibaculum aiptasiae]KAB1157277.1 alpha/beta fold hydrolase [Tenacibaculum aiptasiae]
MDYSDFRESQQFFNTKDGKIAYIDQGTGPTLLLLHGIPTSGWLYRKMIPLLVKKGYRVIAPDMLGFGTSDSPKSYDAYIEKKQAKRVLALMDFLKIKEWTHIFHDASGLWTWELCKLSPERIKRLVILNTIIYTEGFKPPMRFGKNIFTKIVMSLYTFKITNNLLIKNLFKMGLVENILSKTDLEGYQKPLLEGKNKAMYYFFSRTCHNLPNYKEVLNKLQIPTMVIWGKEDEFLKWTPQEMLVSKDLKINRKNIHQIDAKHFIQEEKPEEISNFIHSFIQDNEA